MVFVVLVVGYTPVARAGSRDIGVVAFFGPPARLIGRCLLDLGDVFGLCPAAPPKEAAYPLFEAPRIGQVFPGADGFCCTFLCVAFGSTPRAFSGGGFVEFEKPKDGDTADDHDEGERYDEDPKANGRSSKLGHLELIRFPTWEGLGFRGGLNGDWTRRGLRRCDNDSDIGLTITVCEPD